MHTGIGRLVLWFGCHWSLRIHVIMPVLGVLLLLMVRWDLGELGTNGDC